MESKRITPYRDRMVLAAVLALWAWGAVFTNSATAAETKSEKRDMTKLLERFLRMLEKIRPNMHIVDTALAAMRARGIAPEVVPIRGGTDGSQLSWRGLPTPNLFSGQYNIHGLHEFAVLEDMRASVDTVLDILAAYTK